MFFYGGTGNPHYTLFEDDLEKNTKVKETGYTTELRR